MSYKALASEPFELQVSALVAPPSPTSRIHIRKLMHLEHAHIMQRANKTTHKVPADPHAQRHLAAGRHKHGQQHFATKPGSAFAVRKRCRLSAITICSFRIRSRVMSSSTWEPIRLTRIILSNGSVEESLGQPQGAVEPAAPLRSGGGSEAPEMGQVST